jgi:hypothetical protein
MLFLFSAATQRRAVDDVKSRVLFILSLISSCNYNSCFISSIARCSIHIGCRILGNVYFNYLDKVWTIVDLYDYRVMKSNPSLSCG